MTSHVTRATAMLVAAASLSAGLSAPAMADETGTPTTPDNGTTQPAPSAKETLQNAVNEANEIVKQNRSWQDSEALSTFTTALNTAQNTLNKQDATDKELTDATTALTDAREKLVTAGTTAQNARKNKLKELEGYTGDNAAYYPSEDIEELKTSIDVLKNAPDTAEGDQTIESEITKLDKENGLIARLKKDNKASTVLRRRLEPRPRS